MARILFLLVIFLLEGCQNMPLGSKKNLIKSYISYLETRQVQFTLPNGLAVTLIQSDSLIGGIQAHLQVGAGYLQNVGTVDAASFLTHCLRNRTAKSLPDEKNKNFYMKKTQQFLQISDSPSRAMRKAAIQQLAFWSKRQAIKLQIETYGDLYLRLGFPIHSKVSPNSTSFSYSFSNQKYLANWLSWERKRLSGKYTDGFFSAYQAYMAQKTISKENDAAIEDSNHTILRFSNGNGGKEPPSAKSLWDETQRFFESYYQPKNMHLFIVSDLDLTHTKNLVTQQWSDWENGKNIKPHYPKDLNVQRFGKRETDYSERLQGWHFRANKSLDKFLGLQILAHLFQKQTSLYQTGVFFTEKELHLFVSPKEKIAREGIPSLLKKVTHNAFMDQLLARFQLNFFEMFATPEGLVHHLKWAKTLDISWQQYLYRVNDLPPTKFQGTLEKIISSGEKLFLDTTSLPSSTPLSQQDIASKLSSIASFPFSPISNHEDTLADRLPLKITEVAGMLFQLEFEIAVGYTGKPELLIAIPFWLKHNREALDKIGVVANLDIQKNKTRILFRGLAKKFTDFLNYFQNNFELNGYHTEAFTTYLHQQKLQQKSKTIDQQAREIKTKDLKESYRSYAIGLGSSYLSRFYDAMRYVFRYRHQIHILTPEPTSAWVSVYQNHKVSPRPLYDLKSDRKKKPKSHIWITPEFQSENKEESLQFFLSFHPKGLAFYQEKTILKDLLHYHHKEQLKSLVNAVVFPLKKEQQRETLNTTFSFSLPRKQTYETLARIIALSNLNPVSAKYFFNLKRKFLRERPHHYQTNQIAMLTYAKFDRTLQKSSRDMQTSWLIFGPMDTALKTWLEDALKRKFMVDNYSTVMKRKIY